MPTSKYADGACVRGGYYEYKGITEFTGPNIASKHFHTFKEIAPDIGKMVKAAFKLENLQRNDKPKSNLILSYTQFK